MGPKSARDHEDLRALLNAGYRRGTPVLRCVGDGARQRVEPFAVFGAKALAGIGRLPETVLDRSLPIRLKRRAPGERVERLRERGARLEVTPLCEQLERWAERTVDLLRAARPELPEELDDRAQDACEPLVAIADLAGESWPARARAALVALRGREDGEEEATSLGVRLLADVRALWLASEPQLRASADLVDALRGVEESPWGELGSGLTTRGLARLLRPYGIKPRDIRVGERALKGYRRDQFQDAWRRYLPLPTSASQPSAKAEPAVRDMADIRLLVPRAPQATAATGSPLSRPANGAVWLDEADVAHVADGGSLLASSPAPCRYKGHRPSDWTTADGRRVCGECHPRSSREATA